MGIGFKLNKLRCGRDEYEAGNLGGKSMTSRGVFMTRVDCCFVAFSTIFTKAIGHKSEMRKPLVWRACRDNIGDAGNFKCAHIGLDIEKDQ